MSLKPDKMGVELTGGEYEEIHSLRKRKRNLVAEIEDIKKEVSENERRFQLSNVDSELETLYYVDEGSKPKNKLILNGKKKFNQDPLKGIQFLIDKNILDDDPKAVAQWMYQNHGLSKQAIGELLGLNDTFSVNVLEEFTKCFCFQGMFIVEALRTFLWTFRLPGESQKIDRIMEAFGKQYVDTNPGVFDSADTCFTIAFSCIMLNTLLHNPNVKDKPTLETYTNMNKESLEKKAVAPALLAQIFDSIRHTEFAIPTENENGGAAIHLSAEREGWLFKQGSGQWTPLAWKRRWFVLSEACLYYFDQMHDREPRGIIPLQNVGVRKVESNKPHMFEIFSLSEERIKACKTESDGRVVETRHSVYRVCAANAEDLAAWVEAVAAAVTHYPIRPRSAH